MANGLLKRGRYWNFDFWFKKQRHQGTTRLTNHEKAKLWLSAYRTNLAMTGVGLVQKEAPPLLSVFLNGPFLQHVTQQNANPRTVYCYTSKVKLLAEYAPFKTKRLDQVGELEVQGFKDHRLAQKKSPATINGDLRVLRKALKFADKCGLIRYRGLNVLPGEKNRVFVVSAELEREYLAVAVYPLHEVAVLMLDLGLRPDEAVSLRKTDVDGNAVTVRSGKTSNAKRSLPQTRRTLEVFALCRAAFPDSDWVFPGRKSNHLTRGRVSMAHIELRSDHPVWPTEFLLYSLRHTFGTRLAESGASPFDICALMGHSSVKISERYIHITPDHLGLAMKRKEAYDRLLRGEVPTNPLLTQEGSIKNQ